MRAVLPYREGQPPVPRLGDVPDPSLAPGEVLVDVRATALNRADLLQLRGLYPPPPGEPEVPGLECSGEILVLGEGVDGWCVGQRVMALLGGGGHGERVAVPAGQLMELPESLSFAEGAAIPEAALTAWTNLVVEGELKPGEVVLITGASGGVGSFAVQLAAALGGRVVAAGRDPERLEPLLSMGAGAVCVEGDDFRWQVRAASGGRGADLILDLVGGDRLQSHLAALAPRGRLILVGLMGGARADVDWGTVLKRRLQIRGSVLRPRRRAEKAELVRGFAQFAAGRWETGELKPVVGLEFPFDRIGEAYAAMEKGGVVGKIVVEI